MKKLALIAVSVLLFACSTDNRNKLAPEGNYGLEVNTNEAITLTDALSKLDTTNDFEATVTGTIKEYCKGEGCWLTLENGENEPVFVEVKDKQFVLPHHIEGKTAIVNGVVSKTTNNIGKVEPKITASGILIK
jgi:hypothetical protein